MNDLIQMKLITMSFIALPAILGCIYIGTQGDLAAYEAAFKAYARWWLVLPLAGYLLYAVVTG